MDERFLDNWTTQLRKGLLELCVLRALVGRRLYGYDIARRLRDIQGLVMGEGTIYPILSRFQRDGLVEASLEESRQGPARKYYQLTDRGHRFLARMNDTWAIILEGVQGIGNSEKKE